MKSLAARQAAREKQRANEQKAREDGGLPKEVWPEQGGGSVAVNQSDDPNAVDRREPVSDDDGDDDDDDGMTAEDAESWVDDSVENIKANLSELSDEDLIAIENAEKRLKGRVSVADAIAKERDARKAKGGEWTPGKGGQ
jgi:hypothetical protein